MVFILRVKAVNGIKYNSKLKAHLQEKITMADTEQITGQIKEQTQQAVQQGQQYAGQAVDLVG